MAKKNKIGGGQRSPCKICHHMVAHSKSHTHIEIPAGVQCRPQMDQLGGFLGRCFSPETDELTLKWGQPDVNQPGSIQSGATDCVARKWLQPSAGQNWLWVSLGPRPASVAEPSSALSSPRLTDCRGSVSRLRFSSFIQRFPIPWKKSSLICSSDQPCTKKMWCMTNLPPQVLDHGLHFHCDPHGAKRLGAFVEMIGRAHSFPLAIVSQKVSLCNLLGWSQHPAVSPMLVEFPFAASCLQGHIRLSLYAMPRARQDMCTTKQKATTKFKQILQRASTCGKYWEGSHISKNKARLATSLHLSTSPAPVRVPKACAHCAQSAALFFWVLNPMPNI